MKSDHPDDTTNLEEIMRILGITKNDIELLIKERDDARKSKDYVKADEIRSQLDQNNVILEDIDGKTIWRVKK